MASESPGEMNTPAPRIMLRSPSPSLAASRAGESAARVEKPKLPHERDESVDMTHGEPDPQIEQAYRDVQRGLQDTDRGPPADKAYQKQKH